MGLFDDVVGAATGAAAAPATENSQSPLVGALLSMISNNPGGVSGLVRQFTDNGLGHIVSSWIGTGQNLPISAEQLQSVLSSDQLQAIAAKAGISPEAVSSGLAKILPQLVDHLTPNGEVPQGNLVEQGMQMLKGKFFS